MTASGEDKSNTPSIIVFHADLTEGWAQKSDGGLDVMRILSTPDHDGGMWVTFLGDGGGLYEKVHIEHSAGHMHMTNLTVISMITEDGRQFIRRSGIER
ncbi:MAG: hypothetical protein AABZ06_04760 [Bdellovibrionota bacterium]